MADNKITNFDQLPLVLEVKDLSIILNASVNTVYELIRSAQIRSVKCGRKYLVPKEAFADYLNADKSA